MNIVMILADDLGSWAVGAYGNPEVHTPNIDALAQRGVRFDNFFCTSPVCSPARASILTGQIPSTHGVHDWIRGGNIDTARHKSARFDQEWGRLDHPIQYLAGQTTYVALLQASGYDCALSGKWHLGDSIQPQQGFSHWFTLAGGGCPYMQPDIVQNGAIEIRDAYITDVITDDAVSYIRSRQSDRRPFYLSVHYTAPHSPWDQANHKPIHWQRYAYCPMTHTPDLPLHPNQVKTAPYGTGEARKELLRGYYAAITAMDEGIGRIFDALSATGLLEQTVVLFTSDNGMNMGHHGIWGKGNGTFPLNLYDTSVKVPLIVQLPGGSRGQVSHELLSQYDFMPTICELAGLSIPAAPERPGRSFARHLRDPGLPTRDEVVVFDEYGPARMIRTQRHKYIHRYPYGPHEFYDLEQDPDETCNRYEEEACQAEIASLRARLADWFHRYSDPAVDGCREGVTGKGQIDRAGLAARGRPNYAPMPGYARDDQG